MEKATICAGGCLRNYAEPWKYCSLCELKEDHSMNLFKCRTINQFKIGAWLAEQGVKREDIAAADFPDSDTVRITNPAGQYMEIRMIDGTPTIV